MPTRAGRSAPRWRVHTEREDCRGLCPAPAPLSIETPPEPPPHRNRGRHRYRLRVRSQRLPICAHGSVEHPLQFVLRTKLEVVDRQLRLRGETHVFEIGHAGLSRVRVGFDCVPDTAPKIRFPGRLHRQ